MANLPEGFEVVKKQSLPAGFEVVEPMQAAPVAIQQVSEPVAQDGGEAIQAAAAASPAMAVGLGAGEVAAQMGSGILGMIEGGWRGIADAIANDAVGAGDVVAETIEERTYQPKTDAGKRIQEAIGAAGEVAMFAPSMLYSAFSNLPDILTGTEKEEVARNMEEDAIRFRENPNAAIGLDVYEQTGSPAMAAGTETLLTLGEMLFGRRSPKAYKDLKAQNTTRKLTEFNRQLQEYGAPENPAQTVMQRKGGKVIDVTPAQLEKMDLTPTQQQQANMFVGTNPAAKELKRQGFSDKRIALFNSIEPDDMPAVRRMLDIVRKSKKDARFAGKNRVSDVLGDSMVDRYRFLDRKRKEAGAKLNAVLKEERDTPVSFRNPVNQFIDDLEDLDVGVNLQDGIQIDFSRSALKNSDKAMGYITDLVSRMTQGKDTLFEGHSLKKFIDENSKLGVIEEGLSKNAKYAIGNLRRNLNDAMRQASPRYAEANRQFADTRETIDLMQKAAGKTIDLNSPNASKALGVAFRRVLSNTQSRQQQLDLLATIDRVTGKYGGNFSDSMYDQLLVANELETMFDLAPRNTLQGQVKSGVGQSMIDFSGDPSMAAARAGATLFDRAINKARGINEDAALKAIEDILKRSEKPVESTAGTTMVQGQ